MSRILSAIIELKNDSDQLKISTKDLIEEFTEVKVQLDATRDQLAETNEHLAVTKAQLVKTETQLAKITLAISSTPATGSSPSESLPQSYASILAGPGDPSTLTKSMPHANTLYCTIDTVGIEGREKETQPGTIRQSIEREMRATSNHEGWRCVAVNRDPRNTARIRIACRNENELQQVKAAAQKTLGIGARVLRDQLYPVKVDNACRTAILDTEGTLQPGVIEMLEKENNVKIAKLA